MHYGSRALGLGSILLLAAQAVAAQQQPKDLPEAPAAKQEADHKHDSSLQATFEVLGRRSVFFPDLAASPGPLSSKQKLELFAGKSLAPSRFLSSALSSGVSQARNSLPDYGQGMAGYGKRFGSSMASGASTEFFTTFLFASLFRRDPRYFVSLRGGPWHRIGYGVSRLVVARTDRGREGLNLPKAWQTAISPRPSRPRGIRLVVTGCGLVSPLAAISSRSIGRRSSAACALRRLLRASAPIPLPLGLGHRRHRVCCPDLAVRGAIPA